MGWGRLKGGDEGCRQSKIDVELEVPLPLQDVIISARAEESQVVRGRKAVGLWREKGHRQCGFYSFYDG